MSGAGRLSASLPRRFGFQLPQQFSLVFTELVDHSENAGEARIQSGIENRKSRITQLIFDGRQAMADRFVVAGTRQHLAPLAEHKGLIADKERIQRSRSKAQVFILLRMAGKKTSKKIINFCKSRGGLFGTEGVVGFELIVR